jgi:hypothetical protein
MPFQLNSGDKKILLIAGVFFAILIVLALLFVSPKSSESDIPDTYSVASAGAKAGYLLLKETGYRVERWERSPLEIRTFENTTLILAKPSKFPGKEEQDALQQFVKQGGRLIAIGSLAAIILPINDSHSAIEPKVVWDTFPAVAPSPVTQSAPQITMAPTAGWSSSGSAIPLYGKNTGKEMQYVVVRYAYDKGTVFWWADATPLTNAGLKEPGNMEFFLACLGDKATTKILWDEYFHGYGSSRKSLYGSDLFYIMLAQLGLVAIAVLLTFSRRSGPIRPPLQEIRLSPLEFVETLGGLYEHAHASAAAVDIHYQRFRYWLAKRLGIPGNASIEEFERAMRSRWNFYDAQFAEVLKECDSVRSIPELPFSRALKLIRSLHSYAIKLKLFPVSAKEGKPWKPYRNY